MEMISVVLGGVITILTAISVENMRKPSLKLAIIEPADVRYENEAKPAKRAKYLLVGIENRNLPLLVKWMSRNAALQCHGTVSFHHLDGQNIYGRSMEFRWSSAPEPLPLRIDLDGNQITLFDYHRFQASQRIDIYPGEANNFAVVARFDDEKECWGWSNESYFCENTWRNSKWKLNTGRYLVQVNVYSAGENVMEVFRLINDVPIDDYRLEPATTEDKEKISRLTRASP